MQVRRVDRDSGPVQWPGDSQKEDLTIADARSLKRGHLRTIALEVSIAGRTACLTGKGRYEDSVLHIDVKDSAGDFTIVLNEAAFDGRMLGVGEQVTIRLTTAK